MSDYPKLRNGPTAVGEAAARGNEISGAPYTTHISPTTISRKKGEFSEVEVIQPKKESPPEPVMFTQGYSGGEFAPRCSDGIDMPWRRAKVIRDFVGRRWGANLTRESTEYAFEMVDVDPRVYGVPVLYAGDSGAKVGRQQEDAVVGFSYRKSPLDNAMRLRAIPPFLGRTVRPEGAPDREMGPDGMEGIEYVSGFLIATCPLGTRIIDGRPAAMFAVDIGNVVGADAAGLATRRTLLKIVYAFTDGQLGLSSLSIDVPTVRASSDTASVMIRPVVPGVWIVVTVEVPGFYVGPIPEDAYGPYDEAIGVSGAVYSPNDRLRVQVSRVSNYGGSTQHFMLSRMNDPVTHVYHAETLCPTPSLVYSTTHNVCWGSPKTPGRSRVALANAADLAHGDLIALSADVLLMSFSIYDSGWSEADDDYLLANGEARSPYRRRFIILRSTDCGATWSYVRAPISHTNEDVLATDDEYKWMPKFHAVRDGIVILVATDGLYGDDREIRRFRSFDYGVTWEEFTAQGIPAVSGKVGYMICVQADNTQTPEHPTGRSTMVVPAWYDGDADTPSGYYLYASKDDGDTWKRRRRIAEGPYVRMDADLEARQWLPDYDPEAPNISYRDINYYGPDRNPAAGDVARPWCYDESIPPPTP